MIQNNCLHCGDSFETNVREMAVCFHCWKSGHRDKTPCPACVNEFEECLRQASAFDPVALHQTLERGLD